MVWGKYSLPRYLDGVRSETTAAIIDFFSPFNTYTDSGWILTVAVFLQETRAALELGQALSQMLWRELFSKLYVQLPQQ